MNHLKARRPVVLVVEDEVLIRMNAVDLMEDLGFEVLEAGNGDEAKTILETRGDVVALFTDIDMPGRIDGLGLAKLAASTWPEMRVIVTSGHVAVRSGQIPKGGVFLGKPYSASHLAPHLSDLAEPLRAAG